ncbi:distal tail protein Dit [Bacillus horti]|uniref:Phage tail component-like protein n=1 Tax=Caldalkalibacillus horti TaxID=77523 RepID=A0ABT9W5D3_9BACI|nr:distal tail protein Dit [Bacillus horti]MDQ0168445.1 putative phage tail component-like protein [Bacillus horti]
MPTVGFSYQGIHSRDMGLSVIQISRPVLPPIQAKTMVIPERHGSLYFGYQYDPLELHVELALVADQLLTFQTARRKVGAWLSPEEGLRELIFDDEADKKYYAVLKDTTELEQLLTVGRGELVFLVPDPFAYAVEDDIFTFSEQGLYDFERRGTETSFPLIEVEGQCTAADKLSVTLNDRTIAFSGQLLEGDTLMLDSALMTAKIRHADGRVASAINLISSLNFPKAISGANTLELHTTGEASFQEVTVTCRSRWK